MYALFVRMGDEWSFREIVFEFEKVTEFEDRMLAKLADPNSEVSSYTYFKLPD